VFESHVFPLGGESEDALVRLERTRVGDLSVRSREFLVAEISDRVQDRTTVLYLKCPREMILGIAGKPPDPLVLRRLQTACPYRSSC